MQDMDIKRVKQEIRALKAAFPSVVYDLDQGFVALEMFPFPPGWQPRTGAIVYNLPDSYPQRQPDAYLPEEMEYRSRRPMIMLDFGPEGWSKHCIHDLSDTWVPDQHSMITMTRLIEKSLEYPNSQDPWKAARQHSL